MTSRQATAGSPSMFRESKHPSSQLLPGSTSVLTWTLVAIFSVLVHAQAAEKRQDVGYQAVLENVRVGKPIRDCRVSGADLRLALREIESTGQLPPRAAVRVSNCDLTGSLDASSVSDPVPIRELQRIGIPDAWIRRLEERGIRGVRVIRIPISFRNVHFSGELRLGWEERSLVARSRRGEAVLYTEPVSITYRGPGRELVKSRDLELVAGYTVFLDSFSLPGVHLTRAEFPSAIFASRGAFLGTWFMRGAHFRDTLWAESAVFNRTRFLNVADFTGAVFDGPAYFTGALAETSPKGSDEAYEETTTGHLIFEGARFNARVYFDDSDLAKVSFARPLDPEAEDGATILTYSPAVFRDRAIFRRARLGEVDFSDAEFHGYSDFLGTQFRGAARFERTTFENEADFRDARFGGEVHLDEVRFQKTALLDWTQLAQGLKSRRSATYAILEQNFDRLGDISSKNQAYFWKEVYRESELRQEQRQWQARGNLALRWLWGYGVRPSRIVLWIVLAYALFFVFHLRHFWKAARHVAGAAAQRVLSVLPLRRQAAAGQPRAPANWDLAWSELREVIAASAQATFSLSLKDSWGRGWLYVVQYLVMKPLLLLFAYAVANVSPLLQILARALPI